MSTLTETVYSVIIVPTQFVEANGVRFAYRRLGKPGKLPLVFKQHFTGNLDNWDPAVLDGRGWNIDPILPAMLASGYGVYFAPLLSLRQAPRWMSGDILRHS